MIKIRVVKKQDLKIIQDQVCILQWNLLNKVIWRFLLINKSQSASSSQKKRYGK